MKYIYTTLILFILFHSSQSQTWEVDQGLMTINYEDVGGFPPSGPISKNWLVGVGNGFVDPDFFTIGKDDFIVDFLVNSNALVINDESLAVGIGEENPQGRLHVNNIATGPFKVPATMIGPYSGTGGYLLVNKPSTDVNTALARFQDHGTNTVAINELAATYQLEVNGDIDADNLFMVSDARYKKEVRPISNASSIISQLKPSTYQFDQSAAIHRKLPQEKQFGFLAQEIEEVAPHLVKTRVVKDQEGNAIGEEKAVNYIGLIPLLVANQQELIRENERLSQENADLVRRLDNLENDKK